MDFLDPTAGIPVFGVDLQSQCKEANLPGHESGVLNYNNFLAVLGQPTTGTAMGPKRPSHFVLRKVVVVITRILI